MHRARDALIEIYGSHPSTQEVHANPTYRRLVASYDDYDFHSLRELVERLTEHLRATVSMHDSPSSQVQGCLEILLATKNLEKQEVLRDLALGSYEWSETHRNYFAAACVRIRSWRSYFLSFTDRTVDPRELNQINRNHRYFILDVVPNAFARSTGSENYLAIALHELLAEGGLDGYFYKDYQADTREEVETKLDDECGRAFVFLQLVQQSMFDDTNGTNWCHMEYQAAHAKAQAFLCVRAEEINANRVDPEFGHWYRYVDARGCPVISRTPMDDRQIIESNHQLIRQIRQQMEDIRNESLFGRIPD